MKSKWVMVSVDESQIPWILLFLFASPIRRLRPSITKWKRRSDNEHPCLKPLEALKKPEGEPLTSTEKFAKETHPIIQLTVFNDSPTYNRIRRKKVQLTLSKSFMRSNLRTIASNFFIFIVWTISCEMPTGSRICLFFRKPNCSIVITLAKKGFNLLEITFEISL